MIVLYLNFVPRPLHENCSTSCIAINTLTYCISVYICMCNINKVSFQNSGAQEKKHPYFRLRCLRSLVLRMLV